MSNLEVRIRTADMLPGEAYPVADIPFRLDLIQKAPELIQDIGGTIFGVDTSHDDIQWIYELEDDGTRVFLCIIMDISNVI